MKCMRLYEASATPWQGTPKTSGHGNVVSSVTAKYPPPPLRKHQERQKNDGQTGSRCLDKAALACNARYQPSQE